MNINQLAPNAVLGADGLWKTPITATISYTQDGHDRIKDNEKNSFWFAHRMKCLDQIIANYPIHTALDIGGGNGIISKHLQTLNINAILLEPEIEGATNAHKNGVKYVIHGSLVDAGFVGASFTSVLLLDVLEHIEEDLTFLREVNRILNRDGKLYLTVPAFQFLFSSFDQEVGHFRRYTLGDLKIKLEQAGYKINYQTYFFSFLPIPLFIGRFMINKLKKREKRKSTGHVNSTGILGFVTRLLLWPEQWLIKSKIKIPFGSSCLIVASKIII